MSDNKKTCAPLGHNNGILMTDYRPSRALYTNVSDSNEYRKYLQNNAVKIMDEHRRKYTKEMACPEENKWEKLTLNVKPFSFKK